MNVARAHSAGRHRGDILIAGGQISKRVSIIVLTWNGLEDTRRCLDAIRTHTNPELARVILVDNGSVDGTVPWARSQSWIQVVENGENLGFARGNNIGIEAAPADDDILLVNNDVIVTGSGWLESMREAAMDPAVGIIGCRMVARDGALLHAGTFIESETFWGRQLGGGEVDLGQYRDNREVQGVVFACVYLKRTMLRESGLLDETYGSYFEDTDLCERARRGGWKIIFCGRTTVIHDEHGSSRANPSFDFVDRFRRSQRIFRDKWETQFVAEQRTRLVWHSMLNLPTSYAIGSRNLLTCFEEIGARPAYRYVAGAGSSFPPRESENHGDYLLNVIASRAPEADDPAIVFARGDLFRCASGRRRIGYTMLPVNGFPEEWVRQANEMNEVWVPSIFNAQGFQRCGLTRPLQVVPLGMDLDHFHPGIEPAKLPYGFAFLSVFEWTERDAPEVLLSTFNNVVKRSEDVVLICKVTSLDPAIDVRAEIAKLGLKDAGGRIFLMLNYQLPHYQMAALYRAADCVVSPSRGNGLDLPAMEAMACGVPLIGTEWGAHLDYMNDDNSLLLQTAGCIPAVSKCPDYQGFEWADPDREHLRNLIRFAIDHRDELHGIGARASAEIRGRYSWRNCAERILQRLNALYGQRGAREHT